MADEETRQCVTCKQCLPISRFWKKQECLGGRMPRCNTCAGAHRRELRAQKPEDYRTEWTRKNREAAREWGRKNSALIVERAAAWRKANPERFKLNKAASRHRRRAQTVGGPTGPELVAWVKAQPKRCHWCGVKCANDFAIDHIMPLARGGDHSLRNMALACRSCNCRKAARDPIEWAQMIGKLL